MKVGRPTDYTPELADKICDDIANGQSLRAICRTDDMPNPSTVFSWLNKYPEFAEQYARAREEQAETLADEIIAIADESHNDVIVDSEGHETINQEVIARSRLRVDARKWIASKLKPKKYGEHLDVDAKHSGDVILHLSSTDANL